jgi:hypothetical protein
MDIFLWVFFYNPLDQKLMSFKLHLLMVTTDNAYSRHMILHLKKKLIIPSIFLAVNEPALIAY